MILQIDHDNVYVYMIDGAQDVVPIGSNPWSREGWGQSISASDPASPEADRLIF